MTRLLAELEIDAAIDNYLRAQGVGPPQPIVEILDALPPEEEEMPDEWDELTARAMVRAPGETSVEIVERVLGRMGL